MNYKNLYDKIISNRQLSPVTEVYTERHHIVPRSLGGTDDETNLVPLTAREHFICHYLLTKMYPRETLEWYKMNHAFMMMKANSVVGNRYLNSRLYEALRGDFSSLMSYAQSGERNSQHGTRWIHSIEEKRSARIGKDDPLPNGWYEGRVIDFEHPFLFRKCVDCGSLTGNRNHSLCRKCKKERIRVSRQGSYIGKEAEFLELISQGYSTSKALQELGFKFSNTKYGVGKWAKELKDNASVP